MKKERFAWQRLQTLQFKDFNLMHEGDEDNSPAVLRPLKNQVSDIINNPNDIECDAFQPKLLWSEAFRQQKENKDLKWAELNLEFKLLLDDSQKIILRHNTYPYYPIPEVRTLISKPYVAVLFDRIPGVHFILLDIFRDNLSISKVRTIIFPFPLSSTYESIYLGLQKQKYHKLIYGYWCSVKRRNEKLFSSGNYHSTISRY